MAMTITEDCISCAACVEECPTESISEGDIYVINASTCTECKDEPEGSHCVSVCPVEAIKKA